MRAADLKGFTLSQPSDPKVLEYRERLAAAEKRSRWLTRLEQRFSKAA